MSNCCYMFAFVFFFFNDTATTEIYTLSLHDALPICADGARGRDGNGRWKARLYQFCEPDAGDRAGASRCDGGQKRAGRSEEHTSELQSRLHLVCRLLL